MTASQDFRLPARCKIEVDGEDIGELMQHLVEATVETSRGQPSVCTLEFDSVREEGGDWTVQDAQVFVPWKPIKITAQFGDYEEEVMRGFIKELHTDAPEQMGQAKVIVMAQDESVLLDREHLRKAWSREDEVMSDGDIAAEIASDFYQAETESGLDNQSLYQDGTYYQLLRDRAEANGFEFYVREGTLYFQAPQLDGDPQASIMVYQGSQTNCLRFSVQHDGHKPDEIRMIRAAETGTELEDETFTSNLTLLGREAATSANMGLDTFVWTMPRPSGSTLAEAQARAQAKANENAWKIKGTGELDGTLYGHVLKTHKLVGVYGVGGTYSGLYYVDKVTHVFAATGYRQSFSLLRNAIGQVSQPQTQDALAGVR